MAVQITITWEFISPVLQIITGIVSIDNVDTSKTFSKKNILKCKVRKEPNCIGYNSIKNHSLYNKIFELFKDNIDTMVESYYKGMLLENTQYHWVEETIDNPFIDGMIKSKNEKYENLSRLYEKRQELTTNKLY